MRSQSEARFGPFEIDHKRVIATYKYSDEEKGDKFEIKDETGISYYKETFHNNNESYYSVENVFKLEGKSGEGIIVFYDLGPNAPPCGPEFQILGMKDGSLRELSPRIIVCGQFEKLPVGKSSGALKLLDDDLVKVEVWKTMFGIRIPFKVDFQKMTFAPLMTQGVFEINIHESVGPLKNAESESISLYADHIRNSKAESIVVTEIKKIDFISSYADVRLEQVSRSQLDIKIANIWLKVRVNDREGWVNDLNDFYMLGLMPSG